MIELHIHNWKSVVFKKNSIQNDKLNEIITEQEQQQQTRSNRKQTNRELNQTLLL